MDENLIEKIKNEEYKKNKKCFLFCKNAPVLLLNKLPNSSIRLPLYFQGK